MIFNKEKEAPEDILYKETDKQKAREKEKNSLSDKLWDNLSPAERMYSTLEELKQKHKELNSIKKYENNNEKELKEKLKKKSEEIATKWTPESNAKFSDKELHRARKFIQNEEKCILEAYKPTPNDKLTIGYGHTGNIDGKPITPGMKITKEKAENLYLKDFEEHVKPLKLIKVPLSNNEKIALASLIYNIGGTRFSKSGIIEKLNNGDKEGAFNEFDKYVTQKGKVLNGLVKRRELEKELGKTPDE